MTSLYVDSCSAYAGTTDAGTAGWTNLPSGYNSTWGRFGTGAFSVTQSGGLGRPAAIGAGGAIGFCFKPTTSIYSTTGLIRAFEGTTLHLDVRTDALGRPTITRNGTLLATGQTVLVGNIDYVIQWGFTISDTTGSLELWVNDHQETLTFVSGSNGSQDTKNGGTGLIDNVMWGGGGSAAWVAYVSEIYINSNAGSAPNNGIWGSYRIQARRGSSAGNYAQWTPLSSTNVSNIDDTGGNDGDTSYNSSSTAGQIDTFQFGAITPTGGTIPAIMHRIVARKDDAGTRTIRPKQRQSGADQNGTAQNITTAYAHYTEVVETNPSTSSAYTVSEMRATSPEFGYELTA